MLSASDVAIRVDDLWVRYRTTFEKAPTLKSALLRLGRRQRSVRIVEAVRGVSFDVPHGQVLGIIGANGAGKSTMLRSIAGILPPSAGRIEVHGKVSTLLALGVGFNPTLTGRENIVLGGLAMGLSSDEIEAREEQIAEFADLGEFIDYPMKTYSSGMQSRLAFSVAVSMQPDILLVDEALSAGDAAFRKKARRKMKELCDTAHTILLVSHGLPAVQDLANECLWLHKGQLKAKGEPEKVIQEYTRFLDVGEDAFALEDV